MSVAIELKDNCLVVAPDGDFTIYLVENAYKEIITLLNSTKKVKLELQNCPKLDSASFQLLIALHKEVQYRGYGWEVSGTCENISEFVSFYNMNEILK